MKIAGITTESFVDGPGLRIVIFLQGCDLNCPHCQNPSGLSREGGQEYSVGELVRKIKQAIRGKKSVRGVTFSGGEPFLQAEELAQAAEKLSAIGLDIVTYTGHTYEGLRARTCPHVDALLANTDLLVDGPYIHEQRGLDLRFRGSQNQRIIDMQATCASGAVVLADI